MKRLRKPKLKDGELRVYWGRPDRHNCPDVVLAWQGHRSMRQDTALLHHHLCSRHPNPHKHPIFSVMEPSLIEELRARGYDLTTLKFSIQKLPVKENRVTYCHHCGGKVVLAASPQEQQP